jgi:phosphohistidine phosphatase
MKKLYLVRHAKSSWEDNNLYDMDRPLKGRGIRDAYSSAQWLASQNEKADRIYSSPATRALHTALIFSRELDYPFSEIDILPELYESTAKEMADIIQTIPDHHESAMLFGHNPCMTDFLNSCINHRIDNVPTSGIACLKFPVERWAEVNGQAELIFFDYPKRRKNK